MPEPSIPELLRASFSAEQKPPGFRLGWPEDPEMQARGIRLLADMVKNQALTLSWRMQAFEMLELIAREDVYGWGLRGSARETIMDISAAVLAGKIKRPQRGRGRVDNCLRDNLITRAVAWLVFDLEYSEAAAIEVVREAVPWAGGGKLSARRIRGIVAAHCGIEKYRDQLAEAGIK